MDLVANGNYVPLQLYKNNTCSKQLLEVTHLPNENLCSVVILIASPSATTTRPSDSPIFANKL